MFWSATLPQHMARSTMISKTAVVVVTVDLPLPHSFPPAGLQHSATTDTDRWRLLLYIDAQTETPED